MSPLKNFDNPNIKKDISKGMKVVFCCSEVFPFAKTGGLADVGAALPLALAEKGCKIKVFMPWYKSVRPDKVYSDYGYAKQKKVEFYFIKNDKYFIRDCLYGTPQGDYPDNLERFSFYCQEVLRLLKRIGFRPDIIHANDWQTSLVNIYLKAIYRQDEFYKHTKSLLTIHNLAYQGIFDKSKFAYLGLPDNYFSINYLEHQAKINLLKGGIIFSDLVNTVSPTYAKQIQTSAYGCGLEAVLKEKKSQLRGILNAVDYRIWDPSTDKFIYKNYSGRTIKNKVINKQKLQQELGFEVDRGNLLLGMVSRLAEQKGIDILSESLPCLLRSTQVVILGLGDQKYHNILKRIAKKFKKTLSLNLKFDETLAHKIYAACDVFLLPSRFEPCGLSQLISYKYATVPLVHQVGGLVDTVSDVSSGGGGFVFKNYHSSDLVATVQRARNLFINRKEWFSLLEKIVKYDFSWQISVAKYLKAYKQIKEKK